MSSEKRLSLQLKTRQFEGAEVEFYDSGCRTRRSIEDANGYGCKTSSAYAALPQRFQTALEGNRHSASGKFVDIFD